jgi:hypothetical protein|tara:strand:- start:443 stop:946 length:504 start_codon:yes stop_codon:yes gene_type:complete
MGMGTASASPEKGKQLTESKETSRALIVEQPQKLEGLIETINLLGNISERMGEDKSGDMGGGGGSKKVSKSSASGTSPRNQAIKNMPVEKVVRNELAKHIEKEVKALRKQVRHATRRISRPGNAHKLNELYSKIRRLNTLLANIVEASYDVVKRLFIRVFIDKQPIL